MRIEWYGQSSFRLAAGGLTVAIDPFGDMSAAAARGIEFTPERGRVPFAEDRVCSFGAEPQALVMHLEAPDDETLVRLQGVVVDHVKRFAFREDLGEVAWSRES